MRRSQQGFTLVEMAIVVLLMGLIMAFAMPAFRRMGHSQELKGARDNIVAQVQLARARAMSTGTDQVIHFYTGTYGYDYHNHTPGQGIVGWKLPKGVSYQWPSGSDMNVVLRKNGRADAPLLIPIRNSRGDRDTVAILASGLVMGR